MPTRRKVGICILLALSLFTMGCSIAKAVAAESGTRATDDKQYKSSMALTWSMTEQTFVIMMGCAPPLRSITKIKVPIILTISTSMKKLVSSRGSESRTKDSNGLGRGDNGVYYELGVAGKTVSDAHATKSTFDRTDQSSVDTGKVRRTDHFTVRSDQRGDL